RARSILLVSCGQAVTEAAWLRRKALLPAGSFVLTGRIARPMWGEEELRRRPTARMPQPADCSRALWEPCHEKSENCTGSRLAGHRCPACASGNNLRQTPQTQPGSARARTGRDGEDRPE